MITKTVFLIEDDPDDRDIFETALQQVDTAIQLISVPRCEDAVHQLTIELTLPPDFIFLDLNMPTMSGKECLIELRRTNRITPIIILTTSSNPKDKKETLELGATCFLTKPNSIPELSEHLKAIFESTW